MKDHFRHICPTIPVGATSASFPHVPSTFPLESLPEPALVTPPKSFDAKNPSRPTADVETLVLDSSPVSSSPVIVVNETQLITTVYSGSPRLLNQANSFDLSPFSIVLPIQDASVVTSLSFNQDSSNTNSLMLATLASTSKSSLVHQRNHSRKKRQPPYQNHLLGNLLASHAISYQWLRFSFGNVVVSLFLPLKGIFVIFSLLITRTCYSL